MDAFLQEPALNEANLSDLKALLDVLVPDPLKGKEKEWKDRRRKIRMKRQKGEMKAEVLPVVQ